MAKRGRKPKPTKLKILNGNPGKRALNTQEPQPRAGIPSCPAHLDAEAKKEWRRMAKELQAMGLLTHADRSALAAYCVNWSRWVKAEKMLVEQGEVPESVKGGAYYNLWLSVSLKAQERMAKFNSEFGCTPSSRSAIKVEAAKAEEETPLQKLMREQRELG